MLDLPVVLSGLLVGFVVGLTGMGGGALMTPLLVLGFGVQPLAAISSDLVASAVMKPVGGAVHWHKGTVHRPLVGWLMLGSVPAAFLSVLLVRQISHGDHLQQIMRWSLGVALLFASGAILAKEWWLARQKDDDSSRSLLGSELKPWRTLLIGLFGGAVVGLTSVGSGSLMMVALVLLYPRLRLSALVGTDLVQAIPLVCSAALAHLLFGQFELGLTSSLLLGALPGVYFGARLSSRAPDRLIRPVLVVVLVVSGLKLLGVGSLTGVAISIAAGVLVLVTLRKPQKSVVEAPVPEPDPAE